MTALAIRPPALSVVPLDLAVRAIAGLDADGARVQNEVGFNKLDTDFGRRMAFIPFEQWTYRQAAAIYHLLRKYRGQLARLHDIDYDLIPEPQSEQWLNQQHPSTVALEAHASGPLFVFSFQRNPKTLDVLRQIPGLRWRKEQSTETLSVWHCAANQDTAARVADVAQSDLGFSLDDGTTALVHKLVHGFRAALAASAQSESDPIPGVKLGLEPYPFQWAGARYAIEHANGRALIGDERGVGKTLQALIVLEAQQAYPALIVAPNNVTYKWVREIQRALPQRTVQLIRGKEQIGFQRADLYVTNWESLSDGYDPKQFGEKIVLLKPAVNTLYNRGLKGIVFDESHKAKSSGAQRTLAAKQLAHMAHTAGGVPVRLCLTGTPMQNKPEEIWPQLEILGRGDDFGGWFNFRKTYCWMKVSLKDRPPEEIPELNALNEKLAGTCMVRRLARDVLKDKPALTRSVLPFEIDNKAEYERTVQDACRWFGERAVLDAEFLLSIAGFGDEDRTAAMKERATSAEMRAARGRALVTIQALKAVAVKGKMRQVKEWVTEFLDEEQKSLVLYADHRDVQTTLCNEYAGYAPARILGGMDALTRDQENMRFQASKTRLAICSMKAASEGIDLTAAHDMVTVELGWNPGHHTQVEGRIDRNGQTSACTSYYPIAQGTIEEDIFELIWSRKNRVVGLATDGNRFERFTGSEEDDDEGGIMNALTKRMTSEAGRRKVFTVREQQILDAASQLDFSPASKRGELDEVVDGEFEEVEIGDDLEIETNELAGPDAPALPSGLGSADEEDAASDAGNGTDQRVPELLIPGQAGTGDAPRVGGVAKPTQISLDSVLKEVAGFDF